MADKPGKLKRALRRVMKRGPHGSTEANTLADVSLGFTCLTGLAAEAQELGLGDKLDDPGAVGLDIMQVAIGGAGFARTLERDGLVPAAATAASRRASSISPSSPASFSPAATSSPRPASNNAS